MGIRLRRLAEDSQDSVWCSASKLRIGRLENLEVVIDDSSLSRQHAEIFATNLGWRVRDLRSTNGTFLNGKRLGLADWPLSENDVLKCGSVTFLIEHLTWDAEDELGDTDQLIVEARTARSWDQAMEGLVLDRDRCPRPGEQLLVLLRASHHLGHVEDEKELLDCILSDTVSALDAQRGAIVLTTGADNDLRLRALSSRDDVANRPGFSQSLAQRAFNHGESLLFRTVEDDSQMALAKSVAEGTMASVLCVVLRTPRRKLGVLHLDRGPMQKPFTQDDLYLADALAASVSAAIESAVLMRRQYELFLSTITILAQAVELRDDYTGGHTARVAQYSELLGRQMNLSQDDLRWLRLGAPLHDIGKIGISDAILLKPTGLTPDEYRIMQSHTNKGAAILATVPELGPIIPIARSHHERWDGRGYPDGLVGENIPLLARIVAVADTFDAMTSSRPYRTGLSLEEAMSELKKQSGIQFDPACVEAFIRLGPQLIQFLEPVRSGQVTRAIPRVARTVA